MDISKKLVETHSLTKEECLELFSLFNNSEVMEYLKEEAVKVRKQCVVHVRHIVLHTVTQRTD